jgi:hypothetical protein
MISLNLFRLQTLLNPLKENAINTKLGMNYLLAFVTESNLVSIVRRFLASDEMVLKAIEGA